MLAEIGPAFDSEEHLFEIKWDGIRSLAFCAGGDYRLLSRTRNDQKPRYPELAFLADLPAGTLLDGELVVLVDGIPSFRAVMSRERKRSGAALATLAAGAPVTYVAFDVLYHRGEAVMDRPLAERRALLSELVEAAAAPRLVLSDGVVGDGLAFFEVVKERGVEGMVAKRLDSPYRPGRRSDAWRKVKERKEALALVVGVRTEGPDARSLVIATDFGEGAGLELVGRVGSGISARDARRLGELARELRRDAPLLPCAEDAVWLEPQVYCRISYLERTGNGLRAPVFLELVVDRDG
jgi:ATP-dependent DNA ligase